MGDRQSMQPDLVMIELSPPTAGRVACTVRMSRSGDLGPRRWCGASAIDSVAIERELRAIAGTRAAVARREAPADTLRAHGALLFDLLLPTPVKAELRRRDGGAVLIVGWPEVPWPLVHDGRGFLGQRFDLGEGRDGGPWPELAPPTPDRTLVVADPAGDLPAARSEGEGLAAIMAAAGSAPAYDVRLGRQGPTELLRALRRYRRVHFAGHVDPGGRGWRLHDGHLDAAGIARLRGGAVPRLVFANACRSLGPSGDALLQAGVRHLIGTDLDLPDLQGADFARDVHRALARGLPVGAAVRLARAAATGRDDPAWTAYRLIGDPRTRFAEADTPRQTELRRVVVLLVRRPLPDELDARVEATRRWHATLEQRARAVGGRLLPDAGRLDRVVFGVPARREDDIRRAAALALALVEDTPQATVTLETGRVAVAGEALLGEPLDTAEALNWRRPAGAYLGPGAARALRGMARAEDDRLIGLQTANRPTGPFMGRADELARIERLADRLVDGHGASLCIIGPAGIGKSRLLDAAERHLTARTRLFRVPGDAGGTFGGIERLVRRLCDLDPDDAPARTRQRIEQALARTVGGEDFLSIDALLDDLGHDSETRRRHADTLAAIAGLAEAEATSPTTVVPALRALLEAVAEQHPLTIVVEDAHLAPAPALATLTALMEQPPPALLITTDRPDGPLARCAPGPGHARLDLGPLPATAARALIATLRPESSADALDELVARAEGNPLFVLELAHHDPASDGVLPASIEALMQARIDRLDAGDREILRAAAVIGRSFWQGGVARLVGRPGVEARLERLAAARFVTREARASLPDQIQWRFDHGLLHTVVAAGLPRQLRSALHGRAALWLADELPPPIGPRAADIARHRAAAGDFDRAVHDWLAAADHAEATLAPDSATAALESAEALLGRTHAPAHLRATIEARLGALDQLAGRLDRAALRLTSAIEHSDAGPERARRLARLSAVELARGATDAARRAVDGALDALGDATDIDAAAEVVYQAAWTDYHQGDLDGAQARIDALLETLPADGRRGPMWRLLGTIAQQRGDAEGADYWLRRALAVLRDDVERARVLHGLALVAVQRGEYDDAAAHYARTVRIRARLGDRAGLARTYSNLGTLCGERGDFVRAERYLREAIRIRTRLGHGSLAISHANMVELYLRQGRTDDARAELDRVTALLDAGQAPAWARSELWRIIADVRLQGGELDAAEAAAERAVGVAQDMGDPLRVASGLEVGARIAAARGRPEDAVRAVERAIEIYEDHDAAGSLIGAMGQLADLLDGIDGARAAALRADIAQIREA